ncbi:MAG: hypothetical protein LIO65_00390 [Odoribacter sp.]|nr:hypothetical protein [Odoribacter sp.]
MLKNQEESSALTDEELSEITENPFADIEWDSSCVIRANFNGTLSGSNFGSDYNNVQRYKIFKQFSEQPQLHKVYETSSADIGTIEDFIVGSKCAYTYYIYPICEVTDSDGNTYETVGTPLKSSPIELDDGTVRIIGLTQDEDDPYTYYVDVDNIWAITYNLSDTGFTNNMSKTYSDTFNRYPKETIGNENYRSISIEGLLGRYDCTKDKYIDTYDDIIEWENFMKSSSLKAAIDLRGVVTLGNIDSNSFKYDDTDASTVSANFTFKELDDMDNITIINRSLPLNPITYNLLATSDSLGVATAEVTYVSVPKE